jgi:hypothetical protein
MATTPSRNRKIRVGKKGATPESRVETAKKHATVIELSLAGWTQQAIAAEVGYSDKASVRYVIDKWVTSNGPTHEAVEELRQRQLAQLTHVHAKLWPHLEVNGEPNLPVIDRLIKVSERASRLCGLDMQQGLQVNLAPNMLEVAKLFEWDADGEPAQDVEAEELPELSPQAR